MTDKTGMAPGRVRPIIYFVDSNGNKVLAPEERGKPEMPRWTFEKVFKPCGFEWREASTMAEWDQLDRDLREQDARNSEPDRRKYEERRSAESSRIRSLLNKRRSEAGVPKIELEVIDYMLARLQHSEDGNTQHIKETFGSPGFLWARHNDSNNRLEDHIGPEPTPEVIQSGLEVA